MSEDDLHRRAERAEDRLRAGGWHREAYRLQAARRSAAHQALMRSIGYSVLERMVEDAEAQAEIGRDRG